MLEVALDVFRAKVFSLDTFSSTSLAFMQFQWGYAEVCSGKMKGLITSGRCLNEQLSNIPSGRRNANK